jgi:hypothetical protein
MFTITLIEAISNSPLSLGEGLRERVKFIAITKCPHLPFGHPLPRGEETQACIMEHI